MKFTFSLPSFSAVEFGNELYLTKSIFTVLCSTRNNKIMVSIKRINFLQKKLLGVYLVMDNTAIFYQIYIIT